MKSDSTRREALKKIVLGTSAIGLVNFSSICAADAAPVKTRSKTTFKHSVCRWTMPEMTVEELAETCVDLGIQGIDLLRPEEWHIVERYGLQCSMGTADFASIVHGFNRRENHEELQKAYRGLIEQAAEHGVTNIICFSGNKGELDTETGIENCALGLTPLLKYAKQHQINLVMELLNSEVDHHDYQCDNTRWGVALAEKMGMDNFKLLYDIYHMQIMEGNVIATIKEFHPYIAHYHTAGVPGRHEINDSQELNYPAIMKAIEETGFEGYVAQEFIPTYDNKVKALQEAIDICSV